MIHPHLLVAGLAAWWLPSELTPGDAWKFALELLLLIACICGGGIVPARLVGLVRPVGERVRACVERAAAQVGHAPRGVYEMEIGYANAFALPFLDRLVFAPTLTQQLDDDELCAVAAHELAHLTEPRWVRLGRASIPLLLLATLSSIGWLTASLGPYGALGVVLAELTVAAVWRRVAQRMEMRADQVAKASDAYARALEKIYRMNLVPSVLRTARTHPHLYDRMLSTGVQPDYVRPQAPPRIVSPIFVLFAMIYVYVMPPVLLAAVRTELPSDAELHVALALSGGTAWELGELGRRAWVSHRFAEAVQLYRAAAQLSSDPYYATQAIWALLRCNRCDEVRSELARQLQRVDLSASARADLESTQSIAETCGRWEIKLPAALNLPTPTIEYGAVVDEE